MKSIVFRPLAWPLSFKLLAAVLAALLPALLPLAAALAAFDSLLANQRAVEGAAIRMHEAEEVTRLVFEAQSAARGYVLTARAPILASYEEAVRDMPATLGRLRGLVRGDATQSWRLERAAELFAVWHNQVARSIVSGWQAVAELPRSDPRRQRMLALIEERLALGEGTRLTREIRDLMQSFERSEREQMIAAQRDGAGQRRRLLWLVLAGVPAAFATGLATSLLLARRATRSLRELARAAHEVEQGEIPAPIPYVGRDELTWVARAFNRMIATEGVRRRERDVLARLDRLLQASASLDEAAEVVAGVAPALLGDASGALYFYDASRADLERATRFGAAGDRAPGPPDTSPRARLRARPEMSSCRFSPPEPRCLLTRKKRANEVPAAGQTAGRRQQAVNDA